MKYLKNSLESSSINTIISAFLLLGVSCLAFFGWTIGGVVALEYDISPVSLRLGL